MSRLCRLAMKYETDKCPDYRSGIGHNYTPFYEELFRGMAVKRLLEIGIDTGASLYMWEEYFPKAEIVGVDIHVPGLINKGRIRSFYCDQSNAQSLVALHSYLGSRPFDIMIDDGSHVPDDQVMTANILADRLAPGGLYIIEYVQIGVANILADGILWPWKKEIVDLDTREYRRSDNTLLIMRRPV